MKKSLWAVSLLPVISCMPDAAQNTKLISF